MLFDIGSGTGSSVLDVLKVVEKVTGKKYNVKFSDRRPGDPDRLVSQWTHHTETVLGFRHKYNLEDMIRTAYQWEVIQERISNDNSRICV